jgi:hypothetical protein
MLATLLSYRHRFAVFPGAKPKPSKAEVTLSSSVDTSTRLLILLPFRPFLSTPERIYVDLGKTTASWLTRQSYA